MALEDQFSHLPFGARLPGYKKPKVSYGFTIAKQTSNSNEVISKDDDDDDDDNNERKGITFQFHDADDSAETKRIAFPSIVEYLPPDKKPAPSIKDVTGYLPPYKEAEESDNNSNENLEQYLPPKIELKPELNEYLPPVIDANPSIEDISSYLPPKKEEQKLVPVIYVPPKQQVITSLEELTDYLPPKKEVDILLEELTDYLPPKKEVNVDLNKLTDYLPSKKEINLNLQEITGYLPPKEENNINVEALADYLPPKLENEYLPPTQVLQEYLPPDKAITKNPQMAIFVRKAKLEEPKKVIGVATFKKPLVYIQPPFREYHSFTSAITKKILPLKGSHPSELPIVPLGIQSQTSVKPISITATDKKIEPKIIPQSETSSHTISVVGSQQYGCNKNDECRETDVCHGGICKHGCSLTRGLCIGSARCETRHHVPACICPSMSVARTVNRRSGQMQFDCMPMMMPNTNTQRYSQRQPSIHIRPYKNKLRRSA